MPLLLALLILLISAAPAGAATRGISLGFFDDDFIGAGGAGWLDRARDLDAQIVRVPANWRTVAPARPADPRNPADPAYGWSAVDAAVDNARARGLDVLLTIESAPPWAEGAGRRRAAVPGSWKPSVPALAAFAEAVARRYSDRVSRFQVWNEPNLALYVSPQWVRRSGRWVAFAPGHYRAMLNAAYGAIKSVAPNSVVVTAGTAPYGDPRPGGERIMPVRFWRIAMSRAIRFDALAHHPYAVAGPRRRALNRDDAAIPDIRKLKRVVSRALRRGTALPRKSKRFWVTEISWDSRPPDPDGVPAARHARWLADSFFVLWKQGVDTITWFQIRDMPKTPTFADSNQSGVLLLDGTPKLAARAFAFPFACERAGSGTRVWLRAPAPGPLEIVTTGGRVVARVTAGGSRVVLRRIGTRSRLRAQQNGVSSLTCQV